jgi:hypothetical protein
MRVLTACRVCEAPEGFKPKSEIRHEWIGHVAQVHVRSGNVNVRKYSEHLAAYSLAGEVLSDGGTGVVFTSNTRELLGVERLQNKLGDNLIFLPVTQDDCKKNPALQQFAEGPHIVNYDPVSHTIAVKIWESVTDLWKGLLLAQATHLHLFAAAQRIKPADWNFGLEGLKSVHNEMPELLLAIGGECYRIALEKGVKTLESFRDSNGKISLHQVDKIGYPVELDEIFGPPLSSREGGARHLNFVLDCVFTVVDKVYPWKEGCEVKTEIIRHLYNILPVERH